MIDQEKAERTVDNWIVREITDTQREFLIRYVLEKGAEDFKRSTLLHSINRGDFKELEELMA